MEDVWTEIIKDKISKQRDVLLRRNIVDSAELLNTYISQIEHYDESNREGHAAKVYFNALFGTDFTRSMECTANAAQYCTKCMER